MTRLRLDLAYDGSGYHGWAAQPGLTTVQGEIEAWIQRILRCEDAIELVCAGRTDAGVHARGQVAHLDLPVGVPDEDEVIADLAYRLGRVLPEGIALRRVSRAPDGFDARFSAIWRRYRYRLDDRQGDPLLRHMVVQLPHPVDAELMDTAGRRLLGLHDFTAFCRRREGATTIRTMLAIETGRRSGGEFDQVVETTIVADAFCHSMVRSVMGALVTVGRGQRPPEWLTELLAATERSNRIKVMPAHGLVLEEVGYPPDDQLASRAADARAFRTLPADTDPPALEGTP